MGAVTGMLGLGGGASGTGYGGPGASSQGIAPIVNPVSTAQLSGANAGSQNSLQAQQSLLAALQQQNGLGNQTNVYNQLQGIANGTGPNPAQAQFRQNSNQVGAETAGLIGSQKGMSPALQARLIAQQGAGAQQATAGAGATALAQQQLGAIGAMGNMANTQAANQVGQTNANTGSQQAQQQMLLNSVAQTNNANVGLQSNINTTNAGLAQQTMKGQQDTIGGIINGAGAAMSMADGGQVPQQMGGSLYAPAFAAPAAAPAPAATQGPQSTVGKFLSGMNAGPEDSSAGPMTQGFESLGKGIGHLLKGTPENAGQGPTMANAQSLGLGFGAAPAMAAGGSVGGKLKSGGGVPGKPKYPGNNYANDTVSAKLSPGEVVIPNSVMQSQDPVSASAAFVAKVMAKRRGRA